MFLGGLVTRKSLTFHYSIRPPSVQLDHVQVIFWQESLQIVDDRGNHVIWIRIC